jgi:hypothetical protein
MILPMSAAASEEPTHSTRQNGNNDLPVVVGVEPENNDLEVPLNTMIVVVFNNDMSSLETKDAFSIEPKITGDFTWHGPRTLIFKPDKKLEEKKDYTISISTNAKNYNGTSLANDYSWSFSTEKGPENEEAFGWEFWEPIVTVLTIIGTAAVALVGVLSLRKKRSLLSRYIGKLDTIYKKNKWDPDQCSKKLNALKESLKLKVSQGKVEEYHFIILDKRIDEYLEEVKMFKSSSKPKIVKIFDKDDDKEKQERGPYQPSEPPEPKPAPKAEPKIEPIPPRSKPRIIADDDE